MTKRKLLINLLLIIGLTLSGCGGGGSATKSETTYREVVAIDGYLKNCSINDDNGNVATYTSNGHYRFGADSTGALTANGCVNEDTDLALGVELLAGTNSSVISPITTMLVSIQS